MIMKLPTMEETWVHIPGSGRSPAEGNGKLLLAGYSPWDLKESDTTDQLIYLYLPGNLAS